MTQSATNPFRPDPTLDLPPNVQLAWRLRALIAVGRLVPGNRLPSVRELAEWSGVSVNTVRSIYAQLEREGLAVARHGSGNFVAEGASGSLAAETIAGRMIAESRAAEVDPRLVAIAALISVELEPAVEVDERWLEADEQGARRELRRQIGQLEAELAHYQVEMPALDRTPSRQGAPRVAEIGELERVRDELVARLDEARNAAAQRGARERRARAVRDEIAADPSAHRWESVSAADTGEPGPQRWTGGASPTPLAALMDWWRARSSASRG